MVGAFEMCPAQQHTRRLPTPDEFLADLKYRELLGSIQAYRNPNRLASYLAQTGQEDDAPEIVHAREIALAITRLYTNYISIMAYYLAIKIRKHS
jgi:hypothetical protein